MAMYYSLDMNKIPFPVSQETWRREFSKVAARTVAKTEVAPGVEVSTVFLGLEHGFDGPKPILFETMVFGGDRDGEQWRFTSWADAETHHLDLVDELLAQRTEAS